MKISKPNMAGIIFGGLFALSSWIRYFVLYPDLDRAIVYGLLGLVIMAISYLHNSLNNLATTLYDVEVYLSDKNIEEEL